MLSRTVFTRTLQVARRAASTGPLVRGCRALSAAAGHAHAGSCRAASVPAPAPHHRRHHHHARPTTFAQRRWCSTTPRDNESLPTNVEAYNDAHRASLEDPAGFWAKQAENITWDRPFDKALDTDVAAVPGYRWFPGGQLNTCYNAVDAHVAAGRGDQPAYIHDSAITGEVRTLTYAELQDQVARFAGVLKAQGVTKGDVVMIYMPMVAEAPIAMLAAARLGAIHAVVFGGFAPPELAVRIDDCKPKVIVSASCGLEGASKVIPYKPLVEAGVELSSHAPDACIYFDRPQCSIAEEASGSSHIDWSTAMADAEPADPVPVDSTDPAYILYTSGTTGTPKGVVRDTGGHAVALKYSMKAVYDVDAGDVFWAASDVGWVVGHSYIVYAPLLAGATSVIFEGKPVGTPDAGVFWRTVRRHKVSVLFTAPTALRAIRKEDPDAAFLEDDLGEDFKALFLAGERSDPQTVEWAMAHIKRPVIDHCWQTESGWPMIANCTGYGHHAVKPGSATKPVPGWNMQVLHPKYTPDPDEDTLPPAPPADGYELAGHEELGPLIAKLPLPPGSLVGLWGNEERFKKAYFEDFPGYYNSGDAAIIDSDGYIEIMARTDDVLNVAGHRLSTGALEAAMSTHAAVAEGAVVGAADPIKGQVPVGLIVLKDRSDGESYSKEQVVSEVVQVVREEIGAVAALRDIVVVARLPKTRSGKTLRSVIRSIADDVPYKSPATIEDASVLPEIAEALASIGYASAKQK